MSTELAFNTYVLLGNTLNYLVNGVSPVSQSELRASPTMIVDLHRRIEPLSPQQILPALAALPQGEKALLGRCCRYCLDKLSDDDLSAKLGLPRDVAEDVLKQLSLEVPPNA
jgi:hypothetical protein